jgi:predicted nucleotidyltransferase
MATANTTFTPEVNKILAELMTGVREALGENLVGVYLRGSLATGDFVDTSDVDFLVATDSSVRR